MFAALVLDYRLAFLFLAALSLGTAVPLVSAGPAFFPKSPCHLAMWKIRSAGQRTAQPRLYSRARSEILSRSSFCFCVTVSYACQLPGVPRGMGFGSIPTVIPHNTGGRIEFAAILVPCVDSRFCFRLLASSPNFLRVR